MTTHGSLALADQWSGVTMDQTVEHMSAGGNPYKMDAPFSANYNKKA
jgi:hypothetical protein